MLYPYDIYYLIFVVPAIIVAMLAQAKVQSAYHKYSRVESQCRFTAAQIARKILDQNQLYDIRLEEVAGTLTDHYDPRNRVVRLSRDVYRGSSIASIGIAAHEVGHAIQHSEQYMPIKLRNSVLPVAQIGSYAAIPLVILGLIFGNALVNVGIILFSAVVLFQLVTLPVEFNASSRAIATLSENAYLEDEDLKGAKKVLSAAAMTYVASAFVAVMNLLRILLVSMRRR